jgi:CRP-like cAMP-binding protein
MVAAVRRTAGQASLSLVSDAEFLHTLTPAESDALEDMGEPGTFAAGSVIFEQGGTPDCILLVRGADGAEVVLADRGPGELLGDLSGIDGQPRSASVTALEDVRGLIVPLRAFRGFLMDHPRAAISLLELISRRLREAEARQIPG